MKSRIIVIEGLDGSGKATQTGLLYDKLVSGGREALRLEFPNYSSPGSALVKMYLGGEFGSKPGDVNAYAASAFYAVDRVSSFLSGWKENYLRGTVILSDRYVTSNIIYQMSKLPESEWEGFIKWQSDFEYDKLGLPHPDRVVYLDVEPEISRKLMLGRYNGDSRLMDLHEKDFAYLLECRRSAFYAAEKCGWTVINCCENGKIKPADKISAEIENAVEDILCSASEW